MTASTRQDPEQALAEARRAYERAAAHREGLAAWVLVPARHRLAMIVAVREAAAAGLDERAIAACVDTIRPLLRPMSGSDALTSGSKVDLAFIEDNLRDGAVEETVAFIEGMSRVRGWLTWLGMLALFAATLAGWLWL